MNAYDLHSVRALVGTIEVCTQRHKRLSARVQGLRRKRHTIGAVWKRACAMYERNLRMLNAAENAFRSVMKRHGGQA